MSTTATKTATAHDAHYKDGYQVPEGGDYIVRPQSADKSKRWDMHILIRVADDRVVGTYSAWSPCVPPPSWPGIAAYAEASSSRSRSTVYTFWPSQTRMGCGERSKSDAG
jgi:hypothetical protein